MINGCFISHSSKDSEFVEKLHARLMAEGINVWLDRHDIVAGPIQNQLWEAIQVHHVVIFVLSTDSIESDWVEHELEMAHDKETKERRPVLCPIALDGAWKAKVTAGDGPGDPSLGLWRTVKRNHAVDFAGWETYAFEEAFEKLVGGLRLYYGPKEPPAAPSA